MGWLNWWGRGGVSDAIRPDSEGAAVHRAGDRFYRAHGLGNDYLVFEETEPANPSGWEVAQEGIERICGRGEGLGSDGLLILSDREPADGVFAVRGFNPDGSEFERSGNGLRVMASYLFREGLVGADGFSVRSGDRTVSMTVNARDSDGRYDVSLRMGKARLGLAAVGGDPTALDPSGRASHPSRGPIEFIPVSVGNPHVVVFSSSASTEAVEEVGPFLSQHPAFPHGANVQIAEIEGDQRLHIGIWERGVGHTRASGTSSCAAAVAAVSTGRLDPGPITVGMEGGALLVTVSRDLDVALRGPVEEIADGRLTAGFLERIARSA